MWHTRLLPVAALGSFLALLTYAYTQWTPLTPASVPTLESSEASANTGLLIMFGAWLLLGLDVFRRQGQWPSRKYTVRQVACLGIAAFLMGLPPYVFLTNRVVQTAAAEPDIDRLLAWYIQSDLWRCKTDAEMQRMIAEKGSLLNADLERYGVSPHIGPYDSYCAYEHQFSLTLLVPGLADDERWRFESRLLNVAQARYYLRENMGANGVFSLPLLVAASLGWGMLVAVLTLLRPHANARQRREPRVPRRLSNGRPGLDTWLARQAPILWSSRLHAASWFVLLPTVTMVAVTERLPRLWAPWIIIPAWLLCFFALLRTQRVVGRVLLPATSEFVVFIVHLGALISVGVLMAFVLATSISPEAAALRYESRWENVALLLWAALFTSAALQAARNGTAYTAVAGALLSFAFVGGAFAIASIVNNWLIDLWSIDLANSNWALAVMWFAGFSSVWTTTLMAIRRELAAPVRSTLIGASLMAAPLFGIVLIVLALMPLPRDIALWNLSLSVLAAIVMMWAALFTTADARQALAYSRK
jgi:hypothetical protein